MSLVRRCRRKSTPAGTECAVGPFSCRTRVACAGGRKTSMAQLFTPFDVGPIQLTNRIVIAPMCQYSAADGCMTDWHVIHLGHLALSGAALLTIEATAVVPEGRITY